jgi:serine/threonine-protein kinase
VWASPDQIVLARDNALFVGRLQNGRLEGTPVRLYDDVAQDQAGGASAGVSATGNLIAASADVSLGRLFWVSQAGVDTPVGGPVRDYTNPRLSPDGRLVVFNGTDGLWTLDIVRGTLTKIAPQGTGYGGWIDSTRITYRVNTGVVTMRADGTGGAVPVKGTQFNDYPASVSPDGTLLATVRINQATSGDVYVFPLDGSGPPRPFLATPAYEGGGQFSPDGKWMLFTSDENGEPEVYLTPFPAADRRIAVSSDGGLHPLWSGDGRQIFYRAGQRMMAVDVTPGGEPRLSPPRVLFDRQYKFGPNLSVPHYSLGPEGQGLLMVKEEAGARSLSFISQWLQRPAR